MFDWFYTNETLAWWMLITSIISFVATLIIVPFILTRLPADYFSHSARHRLERDRKHILLLLPLWILKNTLGLVFIILGIIMLALPGQGILTIIVGLFFLEFPGKYRVERRMVSNHSVLKGINWIRAKAGKPALILTEDGHQDTPST